MAVRRLIFDAPTDGDGAEGAVEFVWDDRSTLRVDAVRHRLSVTDRPWRDPFAGDVVPVPRAEITRVGRWVRRDVSRSAPFDRLIGCVLTTAAATDEQVVLDFGGARIEVSLPGVDPLVTVTYPTERREWWRVHWRHTDPDDPVELYYEIVDGWERRKVEVRRDGRRSWASAFVAQGGSRHATVQFPTLDDVNADPQFVGEVIDADRFEVEWQKALADNATTTLWRPTGPAELALVEESGWRRWPARQPAQPFFTR